MAERLQQLRPLQFREEVLRAGPRGAPWLGDRIRLHESIVDEIQGRPAVGRRLAIAIQQLAALGRTTIVKGCSDIANRGWRRTPLGGRGGMQFYLWWTPQGSPQAKSIEGLKRRTMLVRAIRHHDNHKVLEAGALKDYHELSAADIAADSSDTFESPWTEPQQRFTVASSPVRVVKGHPGSGKTVALWKAVESRRGKTLYLTWSSALTDASRSRFEAFASPDSTVDAREFSVFAGSVCRQDIEALTLERSRRRFRDAYAWWKIRSHIGPWANDLNALHAELRAILFGRAVSDLAECTEDGRRLSDEQYIASTRAGEDAARALLEAVKRSDWRSWHERVFPEIAAAHAALDRLRAGDLPESLLEYDRVVIDEAQDLTLVESAVVTEYCRAVASKRQRAPRLMMAFDDGQTVRPSGFSPNRLSNLLASTLIEPEEFHLDCNVRSPSLITDVVRRTSSLYQLIGKDRRPKDQLSRRVDQEIVARLIYLPVRNARAGRELIAELGDVGDVAVVSPRETVPEWVPQDSRKIVHTPEEVKGLEYASACVLDVGKLLKQLSPDRETHSPLEVQARRTAIDGLRVAVSRATENLVFVDIAPDEDEMRFSLELLGRSERFTPADLKEFFRDADLPLDERILIRTRDALALVDTAPERAWQRACQGLRLLGSPDKGAFESDTEIPQEASTGVLLVAARRMAGGGLSKQERDEVVGTAGQVTRVWGSEAQQRAFASFNDWTAGKTNTPFPLIRAAQALDSAERRWLRSALPTLLQSFLAAFHRCAASPDTANHYADNVEAWLELVGFTGDTSAEAEGLRAKAADALKEAGMWVPAERVLERLEAPDPRLAGEILEKVDRRVEAAMAFERARLPRKALANWRAAGNVKEATRLASGRLKSDLQWIVDMQELIEQRPPGIENRLHKAEKELANDRLKSATFKLPRKPRNDPGQGSLGF